MGIMKKLEDRKNKLTALDKERTRVEIMLEQKIEQLKAMGLNTIEEAQAELERRKKQRAEAEAEAERLIQEFDEKYKEFI